MSRGQMHGARSSTNVVDEHSDFKCGLLMASLEEKDSECEHIQETIGEFVSRVKSESWWREDWATCATWCSEAANSYLNLNKAFKEQAECRDWLEQLHRGDSRGWNCRYLQHREAKYREATGKAPDADYIRQSSGGQDRAVNIDAQVYDLSPKDRRNYESIPLSRGFQEQSTTQAHLQPRHDSQYPMQAVREDNEGMQHNRQPNPESLQPDGISSREYVDSNEERRLAARTVNPIIRKTTFQPRASVAHASDTNARRNDTVAQDRAVTHRVDDVTGDGDSDNSESAMNTSLFVGDDMQTALTEERKRAVEQNRLFNDSAAARKKRSKKHIENQGRLAVSSEPNQICVAEGEAVGQLQAVQPAQVAYSQGLLSEPPARYVPEKRAAAPSIKSTKRHKGAENETESGKQQEKKGKTAPEDEQRMITQYLSEAPCAHEELAKEYGNSRTKGVINKLKKAKSQLGPEIAYLKKFDYDTDEHDDALRQIIDKVRIANKNDLPSLAAVLHIKYCRDGNDDTHKHLYWNEKVRSLYDDIKRADSTLQHVLE
ncbi:hypothetical protein SARC_04766, partial [Sphaeroforma arctica JP610]